MPAESYHGAASDGWRTLWLVLTAALVGVGSILALIFSGWVQKPIGVEQVAVLMVVWAAPLAVASGCGKWWAARRRRARIAEIVRSLAKEGFRVNPEPRLSLKAAHFERWSQAMRGIMFSYGDAVEAAWIAWEVDGTLDRPHGAILSEYSFRVAPDEEARVQQQTVLAWPAEHPNVAGEWARQPAVLVALRSMWDRSDYVVSEIPAWDLSERLEGWVCYGDAGAATRLASGQRSFFSALKKSAPRESWHFGDGWIAAIYPGRLQAEGLADFLAHARQVLAAMQRPS